MVLVWVNEESKKQNKSKWKKNRSIPKYILYRNVGELTVFIYSVFVLNKILVWQISTCWSFSGYCSAAMLMQMQRLLLFVPLIRGENWFCITICIHKTTETTNFFGKSSNWFGYFMLGRLVLLHRRMPKLAI